MTTKKREKLNWFKIAQLVTPTSPAFVEKWRQQGVTLYVYEWPDRIVLDNIIVPKGKRKEGIGSSIIRDLISYGDQVGKKIELTPGIKDPHHGTTSRKRLVNFYKRFGFLENKGRKKDYSMSHHMFREPKEIKNELV
jgi:GNAT superfamily N-acetyltransferase